MKKSTNLIYYPGGCYGTFFEWLYFYSKKQTDIIPFTDTGSSHNYRGNLLVPNQLLWKFLKSDHELELCRCHPGIFDIDLEGFCDIRPGLWYDLVKKDLLYLSTEFHKILVIHPSDSTKLWTQNNMLQKIFMTHEEFDLYFKPYGYKKELTRGMFEREYHKKIIELLKNEMSQDTAKQWEKNNFDELDLWELRELLTLYWHVRLEDEFTCWNNLKEEFKLIEFMSLDDLKKDPLLTINKYFNYFETEINDYDKLNGLISEWKSKQIHMNKDELVNDIIESLISSRDFDWTNENITFLDEFYIQKILLDRNIAIKCFGLNKFPTNSKDFSQFLYNL